MRQRFYTAESLDIDQPFPGGKKVHYDKGVPVLIETEGRLYPLIRDQLRDENGSDQAGRAAVVLREWAR